MKKYFKPAAILVLLVMICSVFSSCSALDEMRKAHAFWNNEEKTEILYNDKVYKKIKNGGEMLITNYSEASSLTITEKDVPLLLSDMIGTWADAYDDGKFLEVGYEEYYYLASEYDEFLEKLQNAKLDKSCVFNSYTEEYKLLSDEDNEIIVNIITQPETITIGYDDIIYLGEIYRCDADMRFAGECIEFIETDDGYCLGGYSGEYYVVPEEYNEWIEDFSEEYFYKWY